MRWPLKVARGEVAKAWPPRGPRVLITEPLSTDRIAVRASRPTSQSSDQELFQLTCNYFARRWHAPAKQGHVDQSWSKADDWLWSGNERCPLANLSATDTAYKFIWIGCENVGRVFQSGGPKMPMMTKPMIRRSLFLCPFIFAPWANPLLYDSGDSIFCSSEEDMEEGGAKNSKRPKQGLLCESTAGISYLWRQWSEWDKV